MAARREALGGKRLCIGFTQKARWLGDLFNRVLKAQGE